MDAADDKGHAAHKFMCNPFLLRQVRLLYSSQYRFVYIPYHSTLFPIIKSTILMLSESIWTFLFILLAHLFGNSLKYSSVCWFLWQLPLASVYFACSCYRYDLKTTSSFYVSQVVLGLSRQFSFIIKILQKISLFAIFFVSASFFILSN